MGKKEEQLTVTAEKICKIFGEAVVVHADDGSRHFFNLKFGFDFDLERMDKSAAGYMMQTTTNGKVRVTNFSHETCAEGKNGGFQLNVEGSDIAKEVAEAELLPKLQDALLELAGEYRLAQQKVIDVAG